MADIDQAVVEKFGGYGLRCYTCDASGRKVAHTSWKFTRDELREAMDAIGLPDLLRKEREYDEIMARAGKMRSEWWFPVPTDATWLARIREDYPDEAEGKDDDELREHYADGNKYATTWDHIGDAYSDYEPLADAFLSIIDGRLLVEQEG